MRNLTDTDIGDGIYWATTSSNSTLIVGVAVMAVLLAVSSIIKTIIFAVRTSRSPEGLDTKRKKVLLISILISLGVIGLGVFASVVELERTRMSYFVSRSGLTNFIIGATVVCIIISFCVRKCHELTMFTDLCFGSIVLIGAMFMLGWSVLFDNTEQPEWYITTEQISDMEQTTNRPTKVCVEDTDEWVRFISMHEKEVWKDICDDNPVIVYVVYSEDGDPLIAYDTIEYIYTGDKYKE